MIDAKHDYPESYPSYVQSEISRYLANNPASNSLPDYLAQKALKVDHYLDAEAGHDLDLDIHFVKEQLAESDLSYEYRRRLEKALADKMINEVYPKFPFDRRLKKAAEKMRICRGSGCTGVCTDPKHSGLVIRSWDNKCSQSRLCPDEARQESQRLKRRYMPHVRNYVRRGGRLYYMVLTIKNVPVGTLRECQKELYKNFATMLRRPKWAKVFKGTNGCIARLENPLAEARDWNIHLNVLLCTSGYFSFQEFRKDWAQMFGEQDLSVHYKHIKGTSEQIESAFREIFKYTVKHVGESSQESFDSGKSKAPAMLDWTPQEFYEWYCASHGFRFTRSYGYFFSVDQLDDDTIPMESVKWIGSCNLVDGQYKHNLKRRSLDLILGYKSTVTNTGNSSASSRSTGSGRSKPPNKGNHYVTSNL